MKKLLLFLLVCIPVSIFAQSTFSYNYGGQTRSYILYLPVGLPADAPLVFVMHGYGGNSNQMMTSSDFNTTADANGFAVCYPQGLGDFIGTPHWNAELSISSVDDVGFLSDLAGYLQTQHNLSPDCTYACGMSNGGFMSYTLACQRPDVFRAISSITGTMSGATWNNCNPSTPVPVFQVIGLDDTVVPVDGSMITFGGWGGAPAATVVNDYWKNLNACTTTNVTTLGTSTAATYHTNGINGNEVWFYEITGWGHTWPTAATQNVTGFNAADEIWRFFDSHCARQKGVRVAVKTFLQGNYDAILGSMTDDLRSNSLVPSTEPYSLSMSPTALALMQNANATVGAPELTVTGTDAVVDWVLLEIRDAANPATILASKAALLQRDGDVVDVDGVSAVEFSGINAGTYHVAVKHRNHLGVMTQTPVNLN